LDDATREALGLDLDVKGVFVDMVQENTPAEKGGLKDGDVITRVNGKPVDDPSAFRFMIAELKPGTEIKLDILRDGDEKKLTFTLGNRADYLELAGTPLEKEEDIWTSIVRLKEKSCPRTLL